MTETITPLDVVNKYFDALAAKDFATVASMFTEDVVWHQPGNNQFSGIHRGAAAVGGLLGAMTATSEATFELAPTGDPLVNNTLVAVPVHFSGNREDAKMSQNGLDLLRIEGDRVAEVWLFSSDPKSEDTFWGAA